MRVAPEAGDVEIQQKLDELYSKSSQQDQKKIARQFILPEQAEDQCIVLAISESAVSIDSTMKQQ